MKNKTQRKSIWDFIADIVSGRVFNSIRDIYTRLRAIESDMKELKTMTPNEQFIMNAVDQINQFATTVTPALQTIITRLQDHEVGEDLSEELAALSGGLTILEGIKGSISNIAAGTAPPVVDADNVAPVVTEFPRDAIGGSGSGFPAPTPIGTGVDPTPPGMDPQSPTPAPAQTFETPADQGQADEGDKEETNQSEESGDESAPEDDFDEFKATQPDTDITEEPVHHGEGTGMPGEDLDLTQPQTAEEAAQLDQEFDLNSPPSDEPGEIADQGAFDRAKESGDITELSDEDDDLGAVPGVTPNPTLSQPEDDNEE